MRRRLLLLLLALAPIGVLVFTQAAGQVETDPDKVVRITVAELKKLQTTGSVTVVDVRDAESSKAGRIPGAISVPLAEVAANAGRLKGAKKPLVFYCA